MTHWVLRVLKLPKKTTNFLRGRYLPLFWKMGVCLKRDYINMMPLMLANFKCFRKTRASSNMIGYWIRDTYSIYPLAESVLFEYGRGWKAPSCHFDRVGEQDLIVLLQYLLTLMQSLEYPFNCCTFVLQLRNVHTVPFQQHADKKSEARRLPVGLGMLDAWSRLWNSTERDPGFPPSAIEKQRRW